MPALGLSHPEISRTETSRAPSVLQVSKIFRDVDVSQHVSPSSNQAEELTPEEFAQMKREVEMLGE